MTTPNTAIQTQEDGQLIEAALLQNDLSKMTPVQRVVYYQKVCDSVGLNPFSRPFEYITIKGKLTLYPTKACAEQLRDLKGVSIDSVEFQENDKEIIVTVTGHDKTGRKDIEIGAVSKSDMDGHLQNVRMKALSKAKRRLGFSLCGMSWVDERYLEAISEGAPVTVSDEGEIKEYKGIEENIAVLYGEKPPATEISAPGGEVSSATRQDERNYDDMRPYEPEVLKNVMDVAAVFYEGELVAGRKPDADANVRKVLAHGLDQIFADKNQRYVLCKWLTGEASTKKIDSNYVYALLRWMAVKTFEDNTANLAKVEAHTAYPYALKMQRQLSMFDQEKGEK